MHFKQKIVTDRRQNDIKLYSSVSHKFSQPKQESFNQRMKQQYQINKQNLSSNPQKYTNFQSVKHFQKKYQNNQKNQYQFKNLISQNKFVNEIDRNYSRNKYKSNRILIQENDNSQNASIQLSKDNQKQNHQFANSNKFYENQYQQKTNIVFIDKAFLTKSIEGQDIKRQNSLIYEKNHKNGDFINIAKTITNKKSLPSDTQKSHLKNQNKNLDESNLQSLTFNLVQNCSMVKSQKWQPFNEDQQSQHFNQIKKQTKKHSLLNSKEYIQQKMLKEQILDEIIMKRSVEKQQKYSAVVLKTEPNVQLTKSQEYLPNNNSSLLKSINCTMANNVGEKSLFMDSVAQSCQNERFDKQMINSVNIHYSIPCTNHSNKKAKYRLLSSQQEMLYCSKCAINLLQQGFKVEELKKDLKIKVQSKTNMTHSLKNISSRNYENDKRQDSSNIYQVQKRSKQLENFENKIIETQYKIHQMLAKIDLQIQINQVAQSMELMKKIFESFIKNLQEIKEKEIKNFQLVLNREKQQTNECKNQLLARLGCLEEIKNELNQYKTKFIQMEEAQYHFLLDSFLNKVISYEKNPRKEQKTTMKKNKNLKSQFNQVSNYRSIDLQSKIEKIITLLYHKVINKNGVEISFDKKDEEQSFDYYCQENKQPFRSLFNDEQQQCAQKIENNAFKKNSRSKQQADSPTFQKNV